jgi:hypothetical protein
MLPHFRIPLILGMLKWRQVSSFASSCDITGFIHFSSRAVAKVIDIPEPEPENEPENDSEETSAPNGVTGADSIPPNLEELIPWERLPDVIDVYVDENFFVSSCTKELWKLFTEEKPGRAVLPIKFERQFPPRNNGTFITPS